MPRIRSSSRGCPTDSCTWRASCWPSRITVVTRSGSGGAWSSWTASAAPRGGGDRVGGPDHLPPAGLVLATERVGPAALLEVAVGDGDGLDAGAGLGHGLVEPGALGRPEDGAAGAQGRGGL